MKATDLRIGNWVSDENGDYQIEAEHLDDDVFPIQQTWGILITEEWLLRLGFEKRFTYSSKLFDYPKHHFGIYLEPPIDTNDKWNVLGVNHRVNLKYIHQVQNLFHAMTGEELTFKTDTNEG